MSDPLDFLNEIQRREVEEALAQPGGEVRFLVGAVVQVRDQVRALEDRDKAAKEYCLETCRPELQKRLGTLERFRTRLLGIFAGLVIAGALGGGVFELVKWLKGG